MNNNYITPIKGFYPTVITDKLMESQRFYTAYLGFTTLFECEWYVHLVSPTGIRLAFLQPDHPLQPEHFHKAYQGDGVIYNLEVDDVDTLYNALRGKGMPLLSEIKSEAWGQKHFIIQDPGGMYIDIYQETEPAEEYKTSE